MTTEQALFWTALGCYGAAAFASIIGFTARAEKVMAGGLLAAAAGFLAHVASIGVRWSIGGATPFISISESLSLGVVVAVLFFLLVQAVNPRVRALGVLVMPVAFVLLGWAASRRTAPSEQLVPALQSGWIWLHIIGASTGFSAVLIAAAVGLLYLLKERGGGPLHEKLPPLDQLDHLGYRFVVAGFTLYGMMIVSGAFWANQVKGTFWNWDPVEVWSLISWLTYGIYLHLRITFGWRGRRLAIYSLAAAAAMILSYWGIPFTLETFHTGFRIEH